MGLIEVTKQFEIKGEQLEPVNYLASFLCRNNPRYPKGNDRVLQNIIFEEKKRSDQLAFVEALQFDAESEIKELGIWPIAPNGLLVKSLGIHSDNMVDLLQEIEWRTGIAGLTCDMGVFFEILDVTKSQMITWIDMGQVVNKWMSLYSQNSTSEFRGWLYSQLEYRIEQSVFHYFEVKDIQSLIGKAANLVDLMYEIRTDCLGWREVDSAYSEPQDVEAKNDDEQYISNYISLLAGSRLASFKLN